VRYDNEILYDDEWKALAAKYPSGFTYIPTVSRPKAWTGEQGYVQDKVKKFLPPDAAKACKAYACGGDAMMKALGEALAGLGAEKGQLHYEIW
jgi:NAD(P)H-flavin reductase